jgi:hypothetical protein
MCWVSNAIRSGVRGKAYGLLTSGAFTVVVLRSLNVINNVLDTITSPL